MHVAPKISQERWNRIKSIGLSAGRYVHTSCIAKMIPDPKFLGDPIIAPMVPFVSKGTTYNVGRNKIKRLARRW